MLGIAVITYNREKLVAKTVERVMANTTPPYELVIADDGSTDQTVATLRTLGCRVMTGDNKGVCWNKNRALFYLYNIAKCDVILLLEDDTYPTAKGWEEVWVRASQKYGHIGLAGSWFRSSFISGQGTVDEPFVSPDISGQCEGFSREALAYVGYLDTRFKGYGVGHAEHSMRFVRAGYGGNLGDKGSKHEFLYYLISSSLQVTDPGGNRTPEQVARNFKVLAELKEEQIYRAAWRSDMEMNELRAETKGASTNGALMGTL